MRVFPFTAIARAAFWVALGGSLLLALMPQPEVPPGLPQDKTAHILAFLTLGLLAGVGYPRVSPWRIGGGLALFGAFIEFAQMVPALARDASFADWVADVLAAGTALALVAIVKAARR